MNLKTRRRHVAIRIVISAILLAVSFILSSYALVNAQTDEETIPQPGQNYVIQSGDTLARIAAYAYDDGELFAALCAYNDLPDCHNIQVGTEIQIPPFSELGGETPLATPEPTPTPTLEPPPTPTPDPLQGVPEAMRESLYQVRAGDTLESIADEIYRNPSLAGRICAFNMLSNCTSIEPGIRIFIPDLDELLFGEAQQWLPAPVSTPEPEPTAVETPPAPEPAEPAVSEPEAPVPADTETQPAAESTPTPTAAPVATPLPAYEPSAPVDQTDLSIAQYVETDSRLEIYAFALQLTSAVDLDQPGPYTLLAPSDSAWVAAADADIRAVFQSSAALNAWLMSHLVAGNLSYEDLAASVSVTTMDGQTWPVRRTANDVIMIGDARVTASVAPLGNGTIHLLGSLLR